MFLIIHIFAIVAMITANSDDSVSTKNLAVILFSSFNLVDVVLENR